ncbi:MAG: hypothetical protein ACRDJ9_33485, partial [Dehalococcoidia bacterium]
SGVEFSNSFVNQPLCCPSRATLYTGQYAPLQRQLRVTRSANRSLRGGFRAHADERLEALVGVRPGEGCTIEFASRGAP